WRWWLRSHSTVLSGVYSKLVCQNGLLSPSFSVHKKYEIRPSDTKRRFSRVKISNFLYKLEEESSRVKVTHVKMETGQRGLKEEQVPDDKWTLLAEVTSRQADEK
ncbi:MAG: hypothetical protein AAF368_08360, partial [Planctomycetota bacterium]